MQFLLHFGKRLLIAAMLTCVAVMATLGLGFGGGASSVAHAAPMSSCNYWYVSNSAYGYWDAEYTSDGKASCNGAVPQAQGWLYPCSGVDVTANMDTWLTQDPNVGGTRLAESGRTGLETWMPDCKWHEQVMVYGWGQYWTTPLWACLWTHDATVNLTFDYLCAPAY